VKLSGDAAARSAEIARLVNELCRATERSGLTGMLDCLARRLVDEEMVTGDEPTDC
jgi:hypothetical protein